jgi:hypothetical protein
LAVAQADAGSAAQSAALLGSVGGVRLYPLAGSQFDPLSNAVDATVAGVPLNTVGVSETFSDGLPVRDLPGYSQVMDANSSAQAVGAAMLAHEENKAGTAAH